MNDAVLVDNRIAIGSKRSAQQNIGIQVTILVEIDHAKIVGFADFSGGWLKFAQKQAKEGAFAAAVGADQADAHAGSDAELNFFEEFSSAESEIDIVDLHQLAGLAIGGGKIDVGKWCECAN